MRNLMYEEVGVSVGVEIVCMNLKGRCFTVKKTHRGNNYRYLSASKEKRQGFAMKLLQYVAPEKKILYLDETNFNVWSKAGRCAVDMNNSSKGKNIHVIASISRDGVGYHEGQFGSFDNAAANEMVRVMLRDQATRVLEGTTATAHYSVFPFHAANVIFPDIVTPALCSKGIHHTFAFVADASLMKTMQVGK